MFTGIIEEIGTVQHVRQGTASCVLTVAAEKILSDVKIGDSIAVNGTCLTASTRWMALVLLVSLFHRLRPVEATRLRPSP